MKPRIYPRSPQHEGWLTVPEKGLSNNIEESFGDVFSDRRNLWVTRSDAGGLQLLTVRCEKTVLLKHGYFQQNQEAFTILKYISFFGGCGSKEAGARGCGHPVTISKRESLRVPKGADLRLKRTNGSALGQVFEGSRQIVPIVLLKPLMRSTSPQGGGC